MTEGFFSGPMDSSNTIYKKNRAVLDALYPHMLDSLDAALESSAAQEELYTFDFIDGKKGFPTFSVTDNAGRTMHGHSLFDPNKEAEKNFGDLVADVDEDKTVRIVVFGFGFGYHLKYLAEHTSDNTRIIVIEPFPTVFREALRRVDLSGVFETKKIVLTFSTDPAELSNTIGQGIVAVNVPNMRFCALHYLHHFMPDAIRAMNTALEGFRDHLLYNLYTTRYAAEMMFTNMINNFYFAARSPGLSHYLGAFAGRPIFVVAPGPSLDRNKMQLKRVKGKALIVAVDTATRILLKDGIEPDVIVTIDYQQSNHKKLSGVDTSFAYMFPAVEVYHEIPGEHTGRIVSYYHISPISGMYDPIIGNRGAIPSGGSVLTDAISIALNLGADPLVLMGVDLGFPGERWYADGSFEGGEFTEGLRQGSVEKLQIPDIYGNPMTTYRSFYAFLQYLNTNLPPAHNKVIDATEGGAAIRHANARFVSDVIDEYVTDDHDPREILDRVYDSFTPMPAAEIVESLDQLIGEFKDLQKLARRGLRQSSKAISQIKKVDSNVSAFINSVKKVQSTRAEISEKKSQLEFLTILMDQCMADIFYHDTDAIKDPATPMQEKKKLYREILDLDRDMYDRISKVVDDLFEHFENVKARFLEEEGAHEGIIQR